MNNAEHIEWVREEIERGESSLDTAGKVYSVLRETDPKLVEEFNNAYEMFANGDEDEMPEELMARVYDAMGKAPEYVPFDRNSGVNDILKGLP